MGLMIVIGLICAGIATFIGDEKNFNKVASFVVGATLGVVGIVILLARKPRGPSKAPQSRGLRPSYRTF